MRKISFITIVGVIIMLQSCSQDWLTMRPENNMVTESLKTISEVNASALGLYDLMRHEDYYARDFMYYGDVRGDDLQAKGSTKRSARAYRLFWTADNAPSGYWNRIYKVIANANYIINSVPNVELLYGESEDDLNAYHGEALAIRALGHFDLVRLYGYPYLKDNGQSAGVPIADRVYPSTYLAEKRNTVDEVYTFIINDLVKAVGTLDPNEADDVVRNGLMNSRTSRNTDGRINRWGAMGILSRAYLYKGDYVNAYKYAVAAINGAESNGNRLWTNAEMKATSSSSAIWGEGFNVESLIELSITSTETVSSSNDTLGYLYGYGASSYDDIMITTDYMDYMEADPVRKKDPRYTMVTTISDANATYYYIWKWRGNRNDGESTSLTSSNRKYANIVIMRLSELYLIAAEAAVKNNDQTNAVKYLDAIAARAHADNSVVGQTITVDRVLDERRRELIGEGHRFFDVLRTGGTIKRSKFRTDGTSSSHLTSLTEEAYEFDWNYYRIVLPLPTSERNLNPYLRDQNNPGY